MPGSGHASSGAHIFIWGVELRFALVERGSEHQIEEVGQRLRAMMPWITKNALVDTTRN